MRQKFLHAWQSKILHCPCCGAKLDESKRAHSDRSLTRLLDAEEEDSGDSGASSCADNSEAETEKPQLV